MNNELILEIYSDHYKETCKLNQDAQINRNRNYVILCALEAIAFMMIWNSDLMCEILNNAAKNELKTAIRISNNILQTANWFLIGYVLVRYIQNTIYIERGYCYIEKLENRIQSLLLEDKSNSLFTREGKDYINEYPFILDVIDFFYKFFSPLMFTTINCCHIIFEWMNPKSIISSLCDSTIFIMTTILTVLFFLELHPHIFSIIKDKFNITRRNFND